MVRPKSGAGGFRMGGYRGLGSSLQSFGEGGMKESTKRSEGRFWKDQLTGPLICASPEQSGEQRGLGNLRTGVARASLQGNAL